MGAQNVGRFATHAAFLMVVVCAFSTCFSHDARKEITESREVRLFSMTTLPEADTAERLGFSTETPATEDRPERSRELEWETPEAWRPLPPSAIHEAVFQVDEEPHLRCTVTLLPGDGGGVEANINRWRAQMNLPPQADPSAARATMHVLGRDACFVDVEGTYQGMAPSEPAAQESDWRLLGVVVPLENQVVFVKMVGPATAVEAESGRFEAFCRSLRIKEP